jgi:hypothetical protein
MEKNENIAGGRQDLPAPSQPSLIPEGGHLFHPLAIKFAKIKLATPNRGGSTA